jgi:Uma2 family endonuclease
MNVLVLDDAEIDDVLEERRRLEIDRWDEMWDGVLHMVPPPDLDHQGFAGFLGHVYFEIVEEGKRGRVFPNCKLARTAAARKNYRVPDLVVVLKGGTGELARQGVARSADQVVEICSPGDETYKKFDFYASLGVRELLILRRDECRVELYRLVGKEYVLAPPTAGELRSDVLPIALRIIQRGRAAELRVRHTKTGKVWSFSAI